MRAELHPSFFRAAVSVLAMMLAVMAIAYFWQGYRENLWWSGGHLLSLLIPFAILPVVVCVAWVPLRFEFSETDLTIQFPFRPLRSVPWDDLQYHGWFEGVYGLQFHASGTFTLYPAALPRREWRLFRISFSQRFPNAKLLVLSALDCSSGRGRKKT